MEPWRYYVASRMIASRLAGNTSDIIRLVPAAAAVRRVTSSTGHAQCTQLTVHDKIKTARLLDRSSARATAKLGGSQSSLNLFVALKK